MGNYQNDRISMRRLGDDEASHARSLHIPRPIPFEPDYGVGPEYTPQVSLECLQAALEFMLVPWLREFLEKDSGLDSKGNKAELLKRAALHVHSLFQEKEKGLGEKGLEQHDRGRRSRGKGNRLIIRLNQFVKMSRRPAIPLQTIPDLGAQAEALAACAHLTLRPILELPWKLVGPLSQPILLDELAIRPVLPIHVSLSEFPSKRARERSIPLDQLSYLVALFTVANPDRQTFFNVMAARRQVFNCGKGSPPEIPHDLHWRPGAGKSLFFFLDGQQWDRSPCHRQSPPLLINGRYPQAAPHTLTITPNCMISLYHGRNNLWGYAAQVFEVHRSLLIEPSDLPLRLRAKVVEGLLERARLGGDWAALRVTVCLHCPISMKRLIHPVRSTNCSHYQCFDLSSIQIAQGQSYHGVYYQACPLCQTWASEGNLFIDGLVTEVLSQVDPSVTRVTVDLETGQWSAPARKEGSEVEVLKKQRLNLIDLTGRNDCEPGNPLWNEIVAKPEPGPTLLMISDDDGAMPPLGSIYSAIIID